MPTVLRGAAVGVLALAVFAYLVRNLGNAWDFETFYYAATALRQGLDPYRMEALTFVAGKPVVLPFLYPPAALALFIPFTLLPLGSAVLLWLGLKVAGAAVLVALWRGTFLRGISVPVLLLVAIFGFNAAMLWDLETGNVTVLEQLLLWLAFACYVRDRRWAFAVLVAVASIFKLFPIVFLGLLFVPAKRPAPGWGPALAGLGLFAALLSVPPTLALEWVRGLLGGLPATRPFGEVNPSALGILDILIGPCRWTTGRWSTGAGNRLPLNGAPDTALVLWVVYCVGLLASSRGLLRRLWVRQDASQRIVMGSVAFALLSPRMMAYSYLLLVVPALVLGRGLFRRRGARVVALGLVIVQGLYHYLSRTMPLAWPLAPYAVSVVLMNLSFLLAHGLWWTADRSRGAAAPGAGPRAGPGKARSRPPATRGRPRGSTRLSPPPASATIRA
jgi:hypothetical protein